MMKRVILSLAVVSAAVGCSSHSGSRSTPQAPSGSPAAPAVAQWEKAYAFLGAQAKPTEMVCSWFDGMAGHVSPAQRPALFYNFSDRNRWRAHLITRADRTPRGLFEACGATVPNSVPYTPADIENFLRPFGLVFVADRYRAAGLIPTEIAYAGQSPSDPDIVYADEPGLFGLRLALSQLGTAAFKPGTTSIVQPADAATAALYLRYTKPLLDWYGFKA